MVLPAPDGLQEGGIDTCEPLPLCAATLRRGTFVCAVPCRWCRERPEPVCRCPAHVTSARGTPLHRGWSTATATVPLVVPGAAHVPVVAAQNRSPGGCSDNGLRPSNWAESGVSAIATKHAATRYKPRSALVTAVAKIVGVLLQELITRYTNDLYWRHVTARSTTTSAPHHTPQPHHTGATSAPHDDTYGEFRGCAEVGSGAVAGGGRLAEERSRRSAGTLIHSR
jgi:hypothetical protein